MFETLRQMLYIYLHLYYNCRFVENIKTLQHTKGTPKLKEKEYFGTTKLAYIAYLLYICIVKLIEL